MSKEIVMCVYIHNAMIFRNKKGNHAIWENIDETWEHHTTWYIRQKQTTTLQLHLHVETKKKHNRNELTDTEARLVAARSRKPGDKEMSLKG